MTHEHKLMLFIGAVSVFVIIVTMIGYSMQNAEEEPEDQHFNELDENRYL